MSIFSKIFLTLIIILLIFLGWYTYPTLKKRYFETEPTAKTITLPSSNIETNNEVGKKEFSEDKFDEEEVIQEENETNIETDIIEDQEEKIEEEQQKLKKEGRIYLEITPEDCDLKCKKFSDEDEDFEYCQETCGLDDPSENQDGCDSLSGLKKDYCFKDLAIQEMDFSYCEKISDKNISETCNNRILEEILENNVSLEE